MNFNTHKHNPSYIFIVILFMAAFIAVACSGNNNSDKMVTCPICNGTGRYNSPDIFKSQMPCTGCLGQGVVQASRIMDILKMHTPTMPSPGRNSNNYRRPERNCEHCFGTGTCNSCNGNGIIYNSPYSYGLDPIVCPNCLSKTGSGRGKCQWCRGTGKRR